MAQPFLTDRQRCHRASLSTDGNPDAQTPQRCHSELQESDAPSAWECDPDDPKDVTVFHWGDIEKMSRSLKLGELVPCGHLLNQNRAKMSRRRAADNGPALGRS